MVSIAPAARPSTPDTMISVTGSSLEPGGKRSAPMTAPTAVRKVIVHHISKIFLTWIPWAFMLPEELMLSGRLLRKTPMTKGSTASAEAFLLMRMPMTKDSGTASMRIPSQTMIAALAPPEPTGWEFASSPSASWTDGAGTVIATAIGPLCGWVSFVAEALECLLALRTSAISARNSAMSCSRSSRSWSVTRPTMSSITTSLLGRSWTRSSYSKPGSAFGSQPKSRHSRAKLLLPALESAALGEPQATVCCMWPAGAGISLHTDMGCPGSDGVCTVNVKLEHPSFLTTPGAIGKTCTAFGFVPCLPWATWQSCLAVLGPIDAARLHSLARATVGAEARVAEPVLDSCPERAASSAILASRTTLERLPNRTAWSRSARCTTSTEVASTAVAVKA
mmetsp:Transcript_44456/g.139364  ORF Transcript_44456/g.139364 Transcript_44456/m.139364 type:complete len:393 (+) Transcript_44456:371-1549(+)